MIHCLAQNAFRWFFRVSQFHCHRWQFFLDGCLFLPEHALLTNCMFALVLLLSCFMKYFQRSLFTILLSALTCIIVPSGKRVQKYNLFTSSSKSFWYFFLKNFIFFPNLLFLNNLYTPLFYLTWHIISIRCDFFHTTFQFNSIKVRLNVDLAWRKGRLIDMEQFSCPQNTGL